MTSRTLLPSLLLLCTVFFLFEFTGIDLWVQDHFYHFQKRTWFVDADASIPRHTSLLFYTGPKILIWIIGLTAIAAAIFYPRLPFLKISRRDILVVILTLSTAPALVALGKASTNTFTPSKIRRYGGDVPYVKVIERYPDNDRPAKRGRAFPAGHASGGFALLALAGLASTRRGRAICIAIGITAGSVMGLYQMLKGAHYLSHTVFTGMFCWIIFLFWRKVILAPKLPLGISRIRNSVSQKKCVCLSSKTTNPCANP